MKARYFLPLAAIVLLAGCNKEVAIEEIPQPEVAKTVLEVSIGPSTKTVMDPNKETDGHKVYWSNGDMISVNGIASDALENLPDNTQSASFSFSSVLSTPYNIVYPASIYKDASHVTLPAVQTYKAGGFADGMFPMAGYSAGSNITLSHLCAIVKISITQETTAEATARSGEVDTDNIVAVRFKGRNSEKVSGSFEIDYQTPGLDDATGTGADLEVRVVKSLATSTTDAVVYYLVVPAREYTNGFDVIVQDANGHIMTKSKTNRWDPAAGKLYVMPEFDFVPNGTELGVEIHNASELISFAQAYNNQDYEELGNALIVTLANDIIFDANSSADYVATTGIGNVISATPDNITNYFHGIFDGKGYSISGYTGSVPLFAYTGSSGIVRNIVIAADSDKTIASDNTETLFGAFVGYHKGLLENCVSHADLSFTNITVKQHFYGGLVGRNHGGRIIGCTMNGNVICPATGVSISTAANQAGIGGIAGRSNGDESEISNCHFNGNITVSDGNTYGGITGVKGVNFLVGGIAGHLQEGEISDCDTGTGIIDVRGVFNGYVGGIVGWTEQAKPSTISGCTNNMAVKLASDGGRSVITPTAVAGVVGHGTGATVSSCVNNGAVATTCNANLLYLGGIAGMGDDSSFDACSNYGSLTHTNVTTDGNSARYLSIGGIVGIFSNASTAESCSVSSCINSGALICSQLGTSANTTVDMAGIVGKTDGPALTITNCKNMRGGSVQVTDATNKVAFARTALGGVLGYSPKANTVIRGCYNSARVYCRYTQGGTNNRPSYVGGIVGFLGTADKAACSGLTGLVVDDCHNTGNVWNQNYNNTVTLEGGPIHGGIVGAVLGTSANKASVRGCTSATPAADSTLTYLRGISGGIAGYAGYADIKDNTSSMTITGNNNAIGGAGIVGWSVNSSLVNCTFSGAINASANAAPKNVAGLVYLMDGDSSITSCKVNDAELVKGSNAASTNPAVLVSNAASGAKITDCGVKGTLDGAAITLSSNMITTDGGATVTGTYLLP